MSTNIITDASIEHEEVEPGVTIFRLNKQDRALLDMVKSLTFEQKQKLWDILYPKGEVDVDSDL